MPPLPGCSALPAPGGHHSPDVVPPGPRMPPLPRCSALRAPRGHYIREVVASVEGVGIVTRVLGPANPAAARHVHEPAQRVDARRANGSTPGGDGGRSAPVAPDGGRSADIASRACRAGASTTVTASASTVSTTPPRRRHPLAAHPPQPPIQVEQAMTDPRIVADVAAWVMSRAVWSRRHRQPQASGRTGVAGRPPSMPPPRRWSMHPRDTPLMSVDRPPSGADRLDRPPSSSNPQPATQHGSTRTRHDRPRHTRVHDPEDLPGAIHRKLFAIMLTAANPPTTQ